MERRPRVLQIFNPYLEYGGEQGSVGSKKASRLTGFAELGWIG